MHFTKLVIDLSDDYTFEEEQQVMSALEEVSTCFMKLSSSDRIDKEFPF